MELYLQFGYGMMALSRELVEEWEGGTVILSPRDLTSDQCQRLSNAIKSLPNGKVMFDPQFYLPHADHERLVAHDFWPKAYSTGSFFGGPELAKLMSDLKTLNDQLGTDQAVLPGLLAQEVTDDWLATQAAVLEEAQAVSFGRPLCQTIALSAEACRMETQVEHLLEHAENFKADSYYLVVQHPRGNYLVDDPAWLSNLVDIVAGLKLNGGKVIVGYANHQMLVAAIAKADAITSGTWMNVRSFPPEKFQLSYQEEIKQRAIWYYCSQALSEYKLPFLDIAKRVGALDMLAPMVMDPRVANLFSGGQPSTIGLSEGAAFRYYLSSLKRQVDESLKGSFEDTVTAHENLLSEAETILAFLRSHGISGQMRDFTEIVDVNRAAIAATIATRGPILRRQWPTL
jgi:hypothetical protein